MRRHERRRRKARRGDWVRHRASMRPVVGPAETEVIGIDLGLDADRLRLLDLVAEAARLGIGDRILTRREAQADLTIGITRAGPAHQGIEPLLPARRELEHPFL